MLLRYKVSFSFAIESLYPLVSTPGQQDLTLKASIPESFVHAFFTPLGRSLNEVLQLPEDVRLLLVDELLRVLADYGGGSTDCPANEQRRQPFDFSTLLKPPSVSFGCA